MNSDPLGSLRDEVRDRVVRKTSRGLYNRPSLGKRVNGFMTMLLLVFQISRFVVEIFVSMIYFSYKKMNYLRSESY